MVMYEIYFTKLAEHDKQLIKQSGLESKVRTLLELIRRDPYQTPPPVEKLVGNLEGYLSRRINLQHRIVYQVMEKERSIKVIRMWTHYEHVR